METDRYIIDDNEGMVSRVILKKAIKKADTSVIMND